MDDPPPPSTLRSMANSLVLGYLQAAGFDATHSMFSEELGSNPSQATFIPNPVRHRTLIDGPNGERLVKVVEETDPAHLNVFQRPLPSLLTLVEQWVAFQTQADTTRNKLQSASSSDNSNVTAKAMETINLPPPSDEDHLCALPTRVEQFPIHHTQNILVARSLVIPSLHPTHPTLVTAAADKTLKAVDQVTLECHAIVDVTEHGSVLCLAQHPLDPEVLAIGCMDGTVAIVDLKACSSLLRSEIGNVEQDPWMGSDLRSPRKAHTKLCSVVQFTVDGEYLVTGATDRRVVVHRYNRAVRALQEGSPVREYTLPGPIEGIVICPDDRTALVVSRNTSDAFFCPLSPTTEDQGSGTHEGRRGMYATSLNTDLHDTHPAFVPMDIQLSPSGKFVLMATSSASGRIILWRLEQGPKPSPTPKASPKKLEQRDPSDALAESLAAASLDFPSSPLAPTQWQLVQVRNFYGPHIDEWSKPRVCWLGSESYFAASSDDYRIFLFATYPVTNTQEPVCDSAGEASLSSDAFVATYLHTSDKQILGHLEGHTNVVRDLQFVTPHLCSGSYDKSVAVWKVLKGPDR